MNAQTPPSQVAPVRQDHAFRDGDEHAFPDFPVTPLEFEGMRESVRKPEVRPSAGIHVPASAHNVAPIPADVSDIMIGSAGSQGV